jgi:hypothetical protein
MTYFYCLTSGIPGYTAATNMTLDQVTAFFVPHNVTSCTFKLFIDHNLTGYHVNRYYIDSDYISGNFDAGHFAGDDATGTFANLTTLDATDAFECYNSTVEPTPDLGPVVDEFEGFIIVGAGENTIRLMYTSMTLLLGHGLHNVLLAAYTKDLRDVSGDKLYEAWYDYSVSFPINIIPYGGVDTTITEEESFAIVFGLLAMFSLAVVATLKRK